MNPHRIHLPLLTVEKAMHEGHLRLWKRGHAYAGWKIGNRIVLCDNTFRFDRVQFRLVEIRRWLWKDDEGHFKVTSEFGMEAME